MPAKPERAINVHGHLRTHDDIAARVRTWEQWNVRKFVCLCLHPRWGDKYFTNEEFLRAKDEYPDVLIGFACPRTFPAEGIDGPDDIERYRDQGFHGLKFLGPGRPINDEVYFPIYAKAEELGMPILFHTGFLGRNKANDHEYDIDSERLRPYRFDRIARTFPNLRMCGAHLGGPHYGEALQMLGAHENVFFDISGGGGGKRHVRKIISALLPHAGLETDWADPQENQALGHFESLCFGTDNPEPDVWVPASETIMDALHIPADLRKRFYWDNPARFLGLEA